MKKTVGKLLKVIGTSGVVCVGAILLPLGTTSVVLLTAATAVTSWKLNDIIDNKMKKS